MTLRNQPLRTRYIHRQYLGGPLDGRSEDAPFRGQKTIVPPYINKACWIGPRRTEKEDNYYVLMEPAQKAICGSTYIYEYRKDFTPPEPEVSLT